MKTHICLRPEELNQPLIIRPLPEQPPDGAEYYCLWTDNKGITFLVDNRAQYWSTPIPYASELVVKETWRVIGYTVDGCIVEYKDGKKKVCSIDDTKYWYEPYEWRSSATMPIPFSRRTIKVKFDVKRVQKLTGNDWLDIEMDFHVDNYGYSWESNPYVILLRVEGGNHG